MKKVLFGIMALSMATFAANPGELTGGAGEASVPVRVIAEVIVPTDALVITDAAGNILTDGILLDHEVRTRGEVNHIASQDFKVKRLSLDPNAVLGSSSNTKLTVSLSKYTTTLGLIGGAQPGALSTISSALELAGGGLAGYEVPLTDTTKEHTGNVSSTISIAANQASGKYDTTAAPAGDGTVTLKVVLAAN